MSVRSGSAEAGNDAPVDLGTRLRQARHDAGMTVRELARHLSVSASFVSQLENGKSKPSVATLYALARFLGVSLDQLFEEQVDPAPAPGAERGGQRVRSGELAAPADDPVPGDTVPHFSRERISSPTQAWSAGPSEPPRLVVTAPERRTKLVMDCGVVWEQLVRRTDELDFMEITYPPGSSSTTDGRMLRHDDYEYGYMLEGEMEITVGFDVFTLRAGDAIGFESSIPHLFRNLGSTPARGIWVVHHRHR